LIELSYESLRKAQLEERHESALKQLPEEYFDAYSEYLGKLRKQLSENFDIEEAKALENSSAVFRDLFERRKQKIVFKAIKEAAPGADSAGTEGLTHQEKELYAQLRGVFESYDGERAALAGPNGNGAQKRRNGSAVRVLIDVPQFVWTDNSSYGPFKAGESVELPEAIALLLVKRNAAEKHG